MKKIILIVAAALTALFAFALYVGFRLSAPVHVAIGNAPPDLSLIVRTLEHAAAARASV